MRVMPREISAKIRFAERYAPVWAAHAVEIGVTPEEAAALEALATAARAALSAQQVAQNVARGATTTLYDAIDEMEKAAASMISQIRSKAIVEGNEIYALANLPPAARSRTPITELGKPTDMSAALDQRGALTLKWKCTHPHGATGVVYEIWRRNKADQPLVYVGGGGAKSFVDTSIPEGTSSVTYQIRAIRSTGIGPWVQFNFNFRMTGGKTGEFIPKNAPPKLAA